MSIYETERAQLREQCRIQNIPIISTETEAFIHHYIITHQPRSIIEIGSAVGYSTSALARAMSSYYPQGEIISREISYPHYWQALINTSPYRNTRLLLGNFCYYVLDRVLHGSYDMVFIDGRKSETLLYLQKLAPYIHKTTHIIIDDVIKFKEKMTDCYHFLDNHQIPYTIHQLDHDDGILVIQESQCLIQSLYAL